MLHTEISQLASPKLDAPFGGRNSSPHDCTWFWRTFSFALRPASSRRG
jgi:hypothetical protein